MPGHRKQHGLARIGRRLVVTVVGGTVALVGAVMLFLPPLPGLLVTAVGLGILSTEYRWALRLKESTEARLRRARRKRRSER